MEEIITKDLYPLVSSDNSLLLFYKNDGITADSCIIQNLDPSLFDQYHNYYQQFDQYKEIVHQLKTPPVVNRASDFLNYNSWDKNEHRADFLLPQGIYHIACLEILNDNKILIL